MSPEVRIQGDPGRLYAKALKGGIKGLIDYGRIYDFEVEELRYLEDWFGQELRQFY